MVLAGDIYLSIDSHGSRQIFARSECMFRYIFQRPSI